MTTAAKLWLGFGLLTALLVLSGVAILVRLRSVEQQVNEMATARDLSTTALQLEISLVSYALDIRLFVQTGEWTARRSALQEAAGVEQHLSQYERLARTDRQQQLARSFAPLWQEMKNVGDAMLNAESPLLTQEDSTKLYALRTALEKLLHDEIQVDALARYDAHHGAAARDVRSIVGFALILLIFGAIIAVLTSFAVGRAVVRNERIIAEQSERLRTTLASIGDAVITTDTEGRVTNLNPVAESLTGWMNADATGQPLDAVFRIVNEETRRATENPVKKVLAGGHIVGLANHTVLIGKDGTERPIDDSAAPIRCKEGDVVGCVLVFRDVTERRRIERQMRESINRKSALIHSALDCIIKIDHEDRIIEFNPAAEHTFGYAHDDAIGRQMADLIIPPPLRARHRQAMAHYMGTGEGPILGKRIEMTAMRADGSEFLVELTVNRIPVDGPPIFAAFLRDITEQKRLEHELRKVAADLSEADRRKNEFLAMLAHELRNPLAPIRNGLEIIKSEEKARAGGNSLTTPIEMLDRQVAQMVRLVDDLLDVSRISRGKIDLRKERVELGSVVHHVLEAVRLLVESKKQDLSVTMPPQPIYLNADPTRLAQVLGNLLNNACKFTETGGHIWLTVEVAPFSRERQASAHTATPSFGSPQDEVVIRVRDTGIGIPADHLPHIFDMFTQIDTSLERSVSGLGIGLTLVRTLVELHGGTVEVHSAGVGQGTEFVVRLPVLQAEGETVDSLDERGKVKHEPITDSISSASHVLPPSTKVLVVDDNRDSAASLAMLLTLNGSETHTAHDGLEAVAVADRLRPDIVLLDIGLPKLNGYEAARKIREQSWGKEMVLVALTGWGQDEDRRKSKDAGFDGHMVKPVDHVELTRLLAALLPVARAR